MDANGSGRAGQRVAEGARPDVAPRARAGEHTGRIDSVTDEGVQTDEAVQADEAVIDLRDWELRTSRLAELVSELTGCEPGGALHAVRHTPPDPGDGLEVVARAILDVEQPWPSGFRFAGFLRSGPGVVHHAALRRWERSPASRCADGA